MFSAAFCEEPQPSLYVNPDRITIRKGQSTRIVSSVDDLPKGVRTSKIEWTSADPQIALYKSGNIQGINEGETKISCTVTLSDGSVLSADCPVTVTIPVTGLRASIQSITIMSGEFLVPEIQILPENATNKNLKFESSDNQVLIIHTDGSIEAAAEGKAFLSIVSEDNPSKKIRLDVTVTRKIGKTDQPLTFLGIPWESSCEDCFRILRDKGFIAEESRARYSFTGSAWHWPDKDLLFSRNSAWNNLPVSFLDKQTGAVRSSIKPVKTVGGFQPTVATLIFLNGYENTSDIDDTRLIGVYFRFDGRHERGSTVFCELLKRLEEQYGEFNHCLSKDIPKYYQEFYDQIGTVLHNAVMFDMQEPGIDIYLGEYAVCTLRGADHSGIMINIDTNETVSLFYGRTDAMEMIQQLNEEYIRNAVILEDAGV